MGIHDSSMYFHELMPLFFLFLNNVSLYGCHLIFTKIHKQFNGERIVISTNSVGTIWIYMQNMTLEKRMYSAAIGWTVLFSSVKSIWSKVQFTSSLSLLIFLPGWFIYWWSSVLQSPTVIAFLSIFPFRPVGICLKYLEFSHVQCISSYDYCLLLMNGHLYYYIVALFTSCYSFWVKSHFICYKHTYLCCLLVSTYT